MRSHDKQTWGGKKQLFPHEEKLFTLPLHLLCYDQVEWITSFYWKLDLRMALKWWGQGSYAFGLNAFTTTGLYLLSGSVRLDVHWRSTFNLFCPARMLHCCNAVNSWVVGDIQRSCCHRRLNPWGSSSWRPGFLLTALKSIHWWNLGILVWIHWT